MWKRVKVGVQGRVARFRIPGGAEPAPADGGRQPDDPGYDVRPMPIAASILWKPIDGPPEQDAGLIPVFITQRALAAVHDHCAATRETCFGLLAGSPYRAPETGLPYVVVESTIRLPGVIGDDAKAALMQGWVVAQVVVVVGAGDTTIGGVLRRSASPDWAQECLPFYELVEPASFRTDGSKPTRLRWDNYRTEETALVPPAALSVPITSAAPAFAQTQPPSADLRRATSAALPEVLLPDQFDGGADDSGGWPSSALVGRIARWVAYAAAAVLLVAGLFRLYAALASPASTGSSPGTPAALAVTPLDRLDQAADTLALSIAAFDLRAQLFATRQMHCPELARGLVVVEERWTTYNSVRKDSGVAFDAARSARDRSLYSDVDGVERRVER